MEIKIQHENFKGECEEFYCDCEVFPCKKIFCIDKEGYVSFPSFVALAKEPDKKNGGTTWTAKFSNFDTGDGYWTTCVIHDCLYPGTAQKAFIWEAQFHGTITEAVQFILDDFKCHGIPIHPTVYRYIGSKKYLKNVVL